MLCVRRASDVVRALCTRCTCVVCVVYMCRGGSGGRNRVRGAGCIEVVGSVARVLLLVYNEVTLGLLVVTLGLLVVTLGSLVMDRVLLSPEGGTPGGGTGQGHFNSVAASRI